MEKSTIHLSPEESVMLRRAVNDDQGDNSHAAPPFYMMWLTHDDAPSAVRIAVRILMIVWMMNFQTSFLEFT